MATSHFRERREPITPAGDVDAVIATLADVELIGRDDRDDEDPVLPELDAALVELAELVDAPEPITDDDSTDGETTTSLLERERADFAEVAANTEVDAIPYENAAAFLANTLYAVPPANTRFEWVDVPDPSPDWDLGDAF